MITYVPITDPELAAELFLSRLLYCDNDLVFRNGVKPSVARPHWSVASIREQLRQTPGYFCYAVEE